MKPSAPPAGLPGRRHWHCRVLALVCASLAACGPIPAASPASSPASAVSTASGAVAATEGTGSTISSLTGLAATAATVSAASVTAVTAAQSRQPSLAASAVTATTGQATGRAVSIITAGTAGTAMRSSVGGSNTSAGTSAAATFASGTASSIGQAATSSEGEVRCDLPVFGAMVGFSDGPGRTLGGFVHVPAAEFTEDPASAVVGVSGSPGRYRTAAAPALPGDRPDATYDAPERRWVPVPLALLSPDWTRYTYFSTEGQPPTETHLIHLVDVAGGADRVVWRQGSYEPVDLETHTVYLVHHLTGTDASDGLWRLDVDSGLLSRITATTAGDGWNLIGGAAAWSADADPAAPPPHLAKFAGNRLLRLDLASGKTAVWFERRDADIRPLGVDGDGRPIVQVTRADGQELWLVSGPAAAQRLYQGPPEGPPGAPIWVGRPVSDRQGLWLAAEVQPPGARSVRHAVYLYRPASGLRQVAVYDWPAGQSGQATPAGECR